MGCYVVAEFLLTSVSRGPSAIAEPLVRLGLVVRTGFGLIISTCRANLVLRAIWQCDIFGMIPEQMGEWHGLVSYTVCKVV